MTSILTPFSGLLFSNKVHRITYDNMYNLESNMFSFDPANIDKIQIEKLNNILMYFSTTCRDHHLDEERKIFHNLSRLKELSLYDLAMQILEDHTWIEDKWCYIQQALENIIYGSQSCDLPTLKSKISIFISKNIEHMHIEESHWNNLFDSNINEITF